MAANTEDVRTASPLEHLAGLLLADGERIAERGAAAMQELLPSYAKVPREALTPVVLANTRNLLEAICDPDGDRTRAQEDYRASGEARARQGITSDEMLHAWRIGVGMRASASAHREAEFEMARHEQHHRTNLVRGILFGTLAPAAIRVQAAGYGLDLAASYHAVRTRPTEALTVRALERQLGIADGAGPRRGLAALLDGDLVGFVQQPLPSSVTATVGVGPAAALHELGNSFPPATRALEGALATGATGPVGMGDLGLWPAVIADRDVGDELLRRVIDPVLAQGRTGEAVLETVVRYLANDLRLEVTAEEMFLHVNTVRYRLRRFEELSDMSLRRVDDLVQVWWAVQRHRLGTAAHQAL
jgi:hypothetical protein